MLNKTHDQNLRSWVGDNADFPIQNLPIAICRRNSDQAFSAGIAIGDQILDLSRLEKLGIVTGNAAIALTACCSDQLNDYMALPSAIRSELRASLSALLAEGSTYVEQLQGCLFPQADAQYALPCRIGDYTDFYSSVYHATTVGKLFRPDNPLLPNYKWIPIGYHGRSSSIDVSPQSFHRPEGQIKLPDQDNPVVLPTKRLDYELELGIFVGPGNELGKKINIQQAEDHVFGICLFNDWSARDIQAWEYQPLGPFLAKNFASTVSPWIISMEALQPFRLPFSRLAEDPQPLDYLSCDTNSKQGAIDIKLEAYILTKQMAAEGMPPFKLSQSSFKHSYWSISQLVTHHSLNGCNLRPGDLLGSGTQSGPKPEEAGSLLELSNAGKNPIELPTGEKRAFLEDGDAVIFRGYCEAEGAVRIGLGEVVGTVLC